MATNLDSTTVAGGDDVLATQYNSLRKDVIQNGGDYAASAGSSNAYTLAIDAAIVAYNEGQVFKFKASFTNTGPATLNVNSIGAKSILKHQGKALASGDIKSGDIVYLVYDGTDLRMLSSNSTDISRFGGDGSDGALNVTSGTTTIDAAGAAIVVKNYTTINISVGATLALSNPNAAGTILILKSSTGVVTIAGTINIDYVGGIGGTGVSATNSVANGNPGTTGYLANIDGATVHHGTGGVYNGGDASGGGGGGSVSPGTSASNDGSATGGTGGPKSVHTQTIDVINLTKKIIIFPGSGGGSAAVSAAIASGTSQNAGRGGGALLIECCGGLDFTGTINARGQSSTNSTGTAGAQVGGSAGGGGGYVIILYNYLVANSGTVTVTGGTHGNQYGGGTDGGDGGDGLSLIGQNKAF